MDRSLMRLGGILLAVGATIALVSAGIHPIITNFKGHPEHLLEKIVEHPDFWLADHLVIGLAGLPILAGWFCLTRAVLIEPARTLAQIGTIFAAMGTTLLLMFAVVDGIALRQSALAWVDASGESKAIAFRAADALDNVSTGIESFFILTFFGVSFSFFALVLQRLDGFSTVAARVASVCSVGAVAAGLALATKGPNFTTVVGFRAFIILLVLWTIFTGVQMWRLSRAEPGIAPSGTG